MTMIDPKYSGMDPIERAKILGTLGKIDRRAQYNGPERATPGALLEAVNALGNHTRGLRADTGRLSQQVFNLKLRNSVIVAIVTGVLARGPEIVTWLIRILR